MATPKKSLTAERARELFDYNPETGILSRKIAFGKAKIGVPAGHKDKTTGYICVSADCYPYLVHRLIWLIIMGRWPNEIDHIDLDRTNNKWANLREVTMMQNMANRRAHKDSKSKRKGVQFHPQTGKWRARIYHDGKDLSLGLFRNINDASKAYAVAAQKLLGEYARVA